MSRERPLAGARCHLPQLDLLIVAAAGEQRRLLSEGQRADWGAMTRQFPKPRPLLGVPQSDNGIESAAGKQTSIRTPGDGQNRPTLGVKTLQVCSGSQRPKVDGSVIAPTHQFSVGADGQGGDQNVLIATRPDGRSTGHIPELDDAIPTGGGECVSVRA